MKNRKTVQKVSKPQPPKSQRYSSEWDLDAEWDLQDDGGTLVDFQYQVEHDVDHRYFS